MLGLLMKRMMRKRPPHWGGQVSRIVGSNEIYTMKPDGSDVRQRIMKERHWEIAGWHDAGFRADSHGALPHTPGFSEA
jgi:hypothetical protein